MEPSAPTDGFISRALYAGDTSDADAAFLKTEISFGPTVENTDVSGALNTLAEVTTNLLLFLLIFGLSASVDIKNLVRQLHNKSAILLGVGMQFVVMPLLGYFSVLALKDHGFSPAMGLTLLIVTASPGGSYSNWWCSLFNADLALSVTMTAISTLFSIALLPVNLLLYTYAAYGISGDDSSILSSVDFKTLFYSLAIVIAAIVSGLYTSYRVRSPKFQIWSNRLGSISGLLLITVSAVISSNSGDSESPNLLEQNWAFYVGVAFPCLIGLVLANVLAHCSKLNKPEVVTVSVECCYQNVGIATSAAVAMFNDRSQRAEALCVPLFYGFVEMFVLSIYCILAWKAGYTKASPDEKFCVTLTKTYEVIANEEPEQQDEGIEVELNDECDAGARILGSTHDIEAMMGEQPPLSKNSGASYDKSFRPSLLRRVMGVFGGRSRAVVNVGVSLNKSDPSSNTGLSSRASGFFGKRIRKLRRQATSQAADEGAVKIDRDSFDNETQVEEDGSLTASPSSRTHMLCSILTELSDDSSNTFPSDMPTLPILEEFVPDEPLRLPDEPCGEADANYDWGCQL